MICDSLQHRLTTLFVAIVVLTVQSAIAENRESPRTGTRPRNQSPSRASQADRRGDESAAAGKLRSKVVLRGSSAKDVQSKANREFPLNRLSSAGRSKATEILESFSLYRRLPTVTIPSDHRTYQFFTSYPDVAVSIWRVMKISKCEMWQTGPSDYDMDAGDGSVGIVEVLYRSRDEIIIFCDGHYTSPLLVKPIKARCLVSLKSQFSKDKDGRQFVTHYADMYVSFPSNAVEAAAKLISPVSYLLADRNFREVSMFLELMSNAMQHQPGWIERVADRMDGVLPIRKKQLLKTTARVYVDSRKRIVSESADRKSVSVEDVLAPLRKASQQSNNSNDGPLPIEFDKLVKSADAKKDGRQRPAQPMVD